MNPLRVTAYHEAAHIIVGYVLGVPIVDVSIHPQPGVRDSPSVIFDERAYQDESTLDNARRKIAISVAGHLGELNAMDGVPDPHQSKSDTRDALEICGRVQTRYPDTSVPEEMARAWTTAREILGRPECAAAMRSLVDALLEKGSLTMADVTPLMRQHGLGEG